MTTDKPSIWKAALVAPIGVPLAITLWIVWAATTSLGLAGLRKVCVVTAYVFIYALPVAYGVMLLLGMPIVLLFRAKGWLAWTTVCIGAAVLGAAIWFGCWQWALSEPKSPAWTLFDGALIGLFVGIMFSMVAELPKRVV